MAHYRNLFNQMTLPQILDIMFSQYSKYVKYKYILNREVHKIAILDIRILNTDRNEENILI